MSRVNLTARVRDQIGSRAVKKLRESGMIPGVMYGPGKKTRPLEMPGEAWEKALRDRYTGNTLIDLEVEFEGKQHKILVGLWEVQRHYLDHHIQHVDLMRLEENEPFDFTVPVRFEGKSQGEKEGYKVFYVKDVMNLRCVPDLVPEALIVDMTPLDAGDVFRTGDIVLPEGVELLDDPEIPLVTIASSITVYEEEEEELEEGEELAEGEEGAEGEGEEEEGSEE
jgi:large subunit ribosomal protein L25